MMSAFAGAGLGENAKHVNMRSEIRDGSSSGAVWLRWLIVALAVIAWILLVDQYPVYFKHDDWGWLRLSQTHTFADTFSPDCARAHDGRYRPIPYFMFMAQYRLFGFDSSLWQLLLGFCFIGSMIFYFKLMSRLQDRLTGFAAVAIWLVAFEFLLTMLFWLGDIMYVMEMLLALAGLYFFVTGFRASIPRLAIGLVLMLVAFFDREASVVFLPITAATYIATNGVSHLKLSRAKTIAYSAAALLLTPLYFALFPPSSRDSTIMGASVDHILNGASARFQFYGQFLLSGLAGPILLTCASYYILARVTGLVYKKQDARPFPILLLLAAVLGFTVARLQIYPLAAGLVAIAAFLLPRNRYMLLVWGSIPLFGLLFLVSMWRTYLYEVSFAFAAIAAVQARLLLDDLFTWWNARIRSRLIAAAAVAMVALIATGMAAVKGRPQLRLLRIRSGATMAVKDLRPFIRRLPPRSVVLIVSYESLGLPAEMPNAAEDEKILLQNPLAPSSCTAEWTRVIGRSDLKVADYSTYREDPTRYHRNARVFLCLMTYADHKFASSVGLRDPAVFSIRRGPCAVDILELGRPQQPAVVKP